MVPTGRHSNENWKNSRVVSNKGLGPPASLAEQLKQVLAEREKRLGDSTTSLNDSDYSELTNKPNPAAIVTQNLVEEIRMAVHEANARGMFNIKLSQTFFHNKCVVF